MAAQTARTRHPARSRVATRPRPVAAPRHARRVSGPLRALPAGRAGTISRGRTGAFERLRALPEHRAVDRLLRGRVWIWLIGLLLGGIVAMQVSLLKLNAGISRAVTTTGTLERQNAALEADIARLSSGERVRATALAQGMVMPSAGAVEFLRARPHRDPTAAARTMAPPSDEAAAIMENGGREPGVLAVTVATTTTPVDPAATTTDGTAAAPTGTTTDGTATTGTTTTGTTTEPAPATTTPAEAPATAPTEPAPTAPGTGAAIAPGQG